jgi:hypothetical protein
MFNNLYNVSSPIRAKGGLVRARDKIHQIGLICRLRFKTPGYSILR